MKEIKAFIHRNRAADVFRELKAAGFKRFSFNDVQGTLRALDKQDRDFSVEFGEEVTSEVKIEFVCDDDRVRDAIDLLEKCGRTNRRVSGWVFVTSVDEMYVIPGSDAASGNQS
jgi:nitrogen regulatory protein PII